MAFEFEDKDVKAFQNFTGLRNNVSPESFEPNDLATALNVDITDALRIRRRKGFLTTQAGNFHSLWSNKDVCLVMSSSTLYQYGENDALTVVRTGLAQRPMAYCDIAGRIYFSNGVNTGAFDGIAREWGIRPPLHQPSAIQIGGTLRAGTYQYAMTFQRSDGAESGTGLAGNITLDAAAGIGFANLPTTTDPLVTKRNLYISPFDGDMMYRLMQLGTAETAATYTVERSGALPLNTQHLSPPPAGDVVTSYNGRTYVASGNVLYLSKPFAPELFDLRHNFPFSAAITLVAPMNDGIYVGTEKEIVFLSGNGPEEFRAQNKATYGVIPGTLSYTVAADFTPDAAGFAAVFATTTGICYGLNGGTFHNVTRDKFMFPATERGAGLVRRHGGMVQYLTSLQGAELPASVAF